MMNAHCRCLRSASFLVALSLLGGCGGDGGGGSPTPTPATATATLQPSGTATAAPTFTPTEPPASARVAGLVVLRRDVATGAGDAVGTAPADWSGGADRVQFDRALSHATWMLSGPVSSAGSTDAAGRFDLGALVPGDYVLELTKTLNGNLVTGRVPFTAGEAGADLTIEIGRGAVRSIATHRDGGGAAVEEVRGPDGTRSLTRDGRLVEIDTTGRKLADPDGDGSFDAGDCSDPVWLCGDAGECTPGHQCTCTASCPECDDCGPPVCAAAGAVPYLCGDDGACDNPGDRCVCASSCPTCADCAMAVCLPPCGPVEILAVEIDGPDRIVVGTQAPLRALAHLTDGSAIDVTSLATWESSAEDVVSVDGWGVASAHRLGTADVRATIGEVASAAWTLEVVDRPPLRHIYLQNASCFPFLGPPTAAPAPEPSAPSEVFDALPPGCRQVVLIGATLQFVALGEFDSGQFEDITSEVEWQSTPAEVGDVTNGLFTGRSEGTAEIRAVLDGVQSDPSEVRVVAQRSVVSLSIYPLEAPVPFGPVFEGDDPVPAAPDVCSDCGYTVTVLLGDEIHFRAAAFYDTGEWEDVTERVSWHSSDPDVAPIDSGGRMTAASAGQTRIDASLDEVTSDAVSVDVVEQATLLDLYVYQEGADRVVAKGGEALFRAYGRYDVGFERDVTDQVAWKSSDDTVGTFTEPGVFTGVSAGSVEVWAVLDGVESNHLPMEVFETTDIVYCDPNDVNRGTWSDTFNRVVLESDCAHYNPPAVATLRFTVTERERPGGIFDPCLDLFVYQGDRRIRTIREEGCGEPFLEPGAPEFDEAAPRYQTRAFWDLKDDGGNLVPPGRYTVRGRFYLYYDPVVSIDIDVVAPSGRIPCAPDPCGNGCGYVHACGDGGPPAECPAVCVPLCSCPTGWGITAGECEPCAEECCPSGAECLPGLPPCQEG